MNKLIVIFLLLLTPLYVDAQIAEDKINHFSVCAINSAAIKGISWGLLSNKTSLNLKNCHRISNTLAIGGSLLIGHLKEKYDERYGGFYNKKDMAFNILGSLAGTCAMRIIIGNSEPRNRIPIKDIFDMENDPLISI